MTEVADTIQKTDEKIQPNTINSPKVIKRDSKTSHFDDEKIRLAITKAFISVRGEQEVNTDRVRTQIRDVVSSILNHILIEYPVSIHIEKIQDLVEKYLMRTSHEDIAKAYILYREQRNTSRNTESEASSESIIAIGPNGQRRNITRKTLNEWLKPFENKFKQLDFDVVTESTFKELYQEIPLRKIVDALLLNIRQRIESEPEYSYLCAQVLLMQIKRDALKLLIDVEDDVPVVTDYHQLLQATLKKGIAIDLVNPELLTYDLKKLANAMKPERDLSFAYLSLQTLYDRYFLHENEVRFEIPQTFWMRVAMGMAINESDRESKAIEFYELLSKFDYMCSTPSLFNSGLVKPQMSSCFLSQGGDDLDSIFSLIKDNAMLSKWAGGIGNDWTPIRGCGSLIKGTNGKSSGIVPFLVVVNAVVNAVNQGGKRKGALCSYLETFHIDIEDFLQLRKNTGDERRRTHDMNTANWVPDLFMKRVHKKEEWTLFSPSDAPDLHELYGKDFETAYLKYEALAKEGKIDSKVIGATALWRKMLSMLFETGHPWITFKDPCNIRSPQQHCGTVHSSNLCTEITLNTSNGLDGKPAEVAVCNLGSINLVNHIKAGEIDQEKLEKTIRTAMRMLDNVIDLNYYAVEAARYSNLQHRPVGLGQMGFQDVLHQLNIPYDSKEAVEFADKSSELISYYAIDASINLAKERGQYSSYEGSLWSQGILPIDSIDLLRQQRGAEYLDQDTNCSLDWSSIRQKLKTHGMRNSNVMAIAPTATIANICNVSASIEPSYSNLYVKSNLSGEFTIINAQLIQKLKEEGIWDQVMVNDFKYYEGMISKIARIPDSIKKLYKTAFEIDPEWLIDCASRRQKWYDQSQSLNLYIAKPSGKKIDKVYRYAWIKGLKTTYYCRTRAATDTEKVTISDGALNYVKSTVDGPICSIDDGECESCQ